MRAGPGQPADTEPDPWPAAADEGRRKRAAAQPVEPADQFLQKRGTRAQTVRVDHQRDRGQDAHSRPAGEPWHLLLYDRQSSLAKPQLRHQHRWRRRSPVVHATVRRRRPVDVSHHPTDQPGDQRAPSAGLERFGNRSVPEHRCDWMWVYYIRWYLYNTFTRIIRWSLFWTFKNIIGYLSPCPIFFKNYFEKKI